MPEDKNFITMLGTGNALAPMLQHVFHAAQQQRCGTDHGSTVSLLAACMESPESASVVGRHLPIGIAMATTWLWAAWRMQSPY